MTWTKLDDGFHGHPKIRRLMRVPLAYMLHVQALNYCSCHDLDGKIDPEFVEDQVPDQRDRVGAIKHLEECGLWRANGRGYVIHDFLRYHPSRADVTARRDKDAERKREARSK